MLRRGRVLGGMAERLIGGEVTNFFDVLSFGVLITSTFVSVSFADVLLLWLLL